MRLGIRRRKLILASTGLACAGMPGPGRADGTRASITLVVPAGTGSGSDVLARLLANYAAPVLGQSIVVDNRPGGGGIPAHQMVMRAPADGAMLVFTSTAPLMLVPAINPAARYTLDDFQPVTPVMQATYALLVANVASAPGSVQQLVEVLRGGRGAFASTGFGTLTHLGAELFLRRAGVAATHVPYRGSGAALTELIGGQVSFALDSLTASMPLVRSGHLRALAVTSERREASLPEVPTLAEAGIRTGVISVTGGIFSPRGLPAAEAQRLHRGFSQALGHPELISRFAATETQVLHVSNDQLLGQLQQQRSLWLPLVRELDIRV